MIKTTNSKNVDAYLDAVAGYRAVKRAIQEEGPTPGRIARLADEKTRKRVAYGKLTGREAWVAERLLAAGGEKK